MTDAGVHDAVVIGAGFYGAVIATWLARERGLSRVVLLEQADAPMTRASFHNQARVHQGYHYPRSFTTAWRSRVNVPRFVHDWPDAVRADFTAVYAIARRHSQVTARQFERFCRDIGARLEPADDTLRGLFDASRIEQVFVVEEQAFDAERLARHVTADLRAAGVALRTRTRAVAVDRIDGALRVTLADANGEPAGALDTRLVFNCTYSHLNRLGGAFPGVSAALKHELAEMPLMRLPPSLAGLGVTVMDGPFFSLMPFPPRGVHTLSHVRYTPHRHWLDAPGIDPDAELARGDRASRADRMVRDVERYLPAIRDAVQVDSLFEVKTVLRKNEVDDGRPILFERHAALPGCWSVLGGKIDNIYDVLQQLEAELPRHASFPPRSAECPTH